MILIADSTSSRTYWAIVDNCQIVDEAKTSGINPYFQTRREISHVIRLELPESFFRRRWECVYFYGSGCANPDKNALIESSIVAQFRSPTIVESDLLGAARGLLVHNAGIACIISTGSNSCFYNGENVVANVRPAGYILGDEGSLCHMGRKLLADILKEIAPSEIIDRFYSKYKTDANEILDLVYSHPHANRTIANYAFFLDDIKDTEYGHDVIYSSMMEFFKRNIASYDYKSYPLSIKLNSAFPFTDILTQVSADFGAIIDKLETSIMDGLVHYHDQRDKPQ